MLPEPSISPQRGPLGPFGVSGVGRARAPPKLSRCKEIYCPAAPLIVLGYDEHHKPQAAQFPAADADLVAKAARLMDLKVYEAATEDWPPWPRSCRSAGFTATAAGSCPTSGKACTARSWRKRSWPNRRPRSAKKRTTCRLRPAYPGPGTRSRLHTRRADPATA